jgi:hypothetical protein
LLHAVGNPEFENPTKFIDMTQKRKSNFSKASFRRSKPLENTTELTYDKMPRKVRRKFDRCTDPNFVYTYTDVNGEIVSVDIPNPNY